MKRTELMLNIYTHIIWDWNGTLFDDVSLCVDIINGMLTQYHLSPITIQKHREIFTFPVRHYYEDLGFDFAQYSFEDLSRQFIDQYEARRHECSLYPSARDVLAQIKESSISQSILSAYPQNTLVKVVEMFSLQNYFGRLIGLDNIYAGGKVEQGKRWIADFGHAKPKTLLIGDTVHDSEVAKAIGVDCLLIAQGHHSKKRLQQCGVLVVDSLDDLFRKSDTLPGNGLRIVLEPPQRAKLE